MNQGHLDFLASPDWARWLESQTLPWVLDVADIGDDVLELGPGPGLTTDLLRERARRVTAVELDDDLAAALAARMAGTNVEVIHADATQSGLAGDRFSAAACFSMLHHVPSAELQDRVFEEVHRVLRPGGVFVATDALDLDFIRDGHEDDVFTPVPPATLPDRLAAAGFTDVVVDPTDSELRFRATKPDDR